MKTKLLILFLTLVASVGSIYADYTRKVTIDDFCYLLDDDTKTAKVTYKKVTYFNNYMYYNMDAWQSGDRYNYVHMWNIKTANIPEHIEYNGETYSVISIGEHAFENCDSLRSITMPNCITSIESNAFCACESLQSISISRGLTTIESNAFASCWKLKAVHVSDIAAWCTINFNKSNPLSFAHNLYLNGDLVTDLVIPEGVTNIAKHAFYKCTCINSAVIPCSTTIIDDEAFSDCKNLGSVIISDGVTNIKNKAFCNCDSISSIIIPKSVTHIERDAFSGSTHLRHVTLNSDSIVSRTYTGIECIGGWKNPLFGDSVEKYIIGEGIKNIGDYAFSSSKNLRSVSISQSVTRIGNRAFSNCYELYTINIPDSVTYIGEGAFFGCEKLTSINLPHSITSIEDKTFSCSGLTSIEVPNNVTSIGWQAFLQCRSLTSITIPNSVTSIGWQAFCRCSSLPSIEIPNSVTTIGASAFGNCQGLESIVISNSVTSLEEYTFDGCSNLSSITFPNNLITIGNYCFRDCHILDSLKIPHSVKSIGEDAFHGCSALTSIELSDSLESIGRRCFELCLKLRSITVPSKVKSIGELAFFNITKEIILLPTTPPVIVVPEYSRPRCCSNDNIPIYVPCGTLETYMATEWINHNFQYKPNAYKIDASAADSLKGEVMVGNNSCLSLISAIPYEGNYFVRWSDGNTENPRTITLTQDTTITAIFATQKFTITFVSEDSVLSAELWEYGSTPVYGGDTPTKAEDGEYTYTFSDWSPTIIPVVADATYMATFTATPKAEAIDKTTDNSEVPAKQMGNGNIYILMPNGRKYSIIGEQVK